MEEAWKNSRKEKRDFQIVVKPNLSMLLKRSEVATYTDPFLLVHLLRLLWARGFENLWMVESGNLYGNWFANRGVLQVAARAGLLDESKFSAYAEAGRAEIRIAGGRAKATLVDLTREMIVHDFGPPHGKFLIGRTWKEADFRINFPKMKTHFYSFYTLAVKNLYGCLPLQNKVRAYHGRRVVAEWTAALIKEFPVHFTIVDAYTAADGWMGVKMKALPKKTHTLIAGEDLLAIDHFGASLMGLPPESSVLYRRLAEIMPPRPYRVIGDCERPARWRNPPGFMVFASRLFEANPRIMELAGALATGGHDHCFPPRLPYGKTANKIVSFLSRPVAYFSDLGAARFRRRRKRFFKKLLEKQDRLPLLTGSRFFLSRLVYLGGEEISALAKILEEFPAADFELSGHYLCGGGKETVLPFRFSTSTLAVFEIVKYAHEKRLDLAALRREFLLLREQCGDLFGEGYPYCYR